MIFAKSPEGIRRRLLINDNLLLTNQQDEVEVELIDDKLQLDMTFIFRFDNEGTPYTSTGVLSDDGRTVTMTLHKWDTSSIDLIEPFKLPTPSGKPMWLQFRCGVSGPTKLRFFHVTFWGEE